MNFYSVSAKTGENVHEALLELINKMAQKKFGIDIILLKDIYMMFLLHLNEDLDDDLLQDAMDTLVDNPQQND